MQHPGDPIRREDPLDFDAEVRALGSGGSVRFEIDGGAATGWAVPSRGKARDSDAADERFLLPDASFLDVFVNDPPNRMLCFAANRWPGPFLMSEAKAGAPRLNVPGPSRTRSILKSFGSPVVARPESREKDAPVEVRVATDGAWRLVAGDETDRATLRAAAPGKLLLVCTGNTCRSPMAEHFLRAAIARVTHSAAEAATPAGFVVSSAGLAAPTGAPASGGALRAVRRRGGDLSNHAARMLETEDDAEVDMVLCMSSAHSEGVRSRWPKFRGRILTFDPSGAGVPDPFGQSDAIYDRTAERLADLARHWAAEIVELFGGGDVRKEKD